MRFYSGLLVWTCVAFGTAAAAAPSPPSAQYHTLPPLREQAAIQDAWTAERKTIIPGLLHKYSVDAWLVGSCYLWQCFVCCRV